MRTIYLIDDGGAVKTNNLRAVELLKKHGYRECSHEEYARQIRWLQLEEEIQLCRDRRETQRCKGDGP